MLTLFELMAFPNMVPDSEKKLFASQTGTGRQKAALTSCSHFRHGPGAFPACRAPRVSRASDGLVPGGSSSSGVQVYADNPSLKTFLVIFVIFGAFMMADLASLLAEASFRKMPHARLPGQYSHWCHHRGYGGKKSHATGGASLIRVV